MRVSRWATRCLLLLMLPLATTCAHRQVTRIPVGSTTDLSGRWNDTDSRLVSEEMIRDCIASPWVEQHTLQTGKKPAVIVGSVRNKSDEHIAVGTFTGDIERALINSGKITMVASAEEREQVRAEREEQQQVASEETMKRWGREHGADYLMGWVIQTITDQEGGETVVFYQVDLNLVHVESNEKVWQGQQKIKKYIGRKKVDF